MVGKEPYNVEEMETILADPKNKNLKRVLSKYNIQEVTRCASTASISEISWIEIWVLVLSVLIGLMALIAACTLSCLYRNFKKEQKKRMKKRPPSTADYMTIRTGTQLASPASGSLMGSQLIIPGSQLGGSQMYINKSDRSVLGSQYLTPKGRI